VFRLLLFPLRLVRTVIRIVGVKNSLFLLIGVGIGLLVAPTTGQDLRARLAAQLESRRLGAGAAVEPLGSGVAAPEPASV
jgi:hypothetical protein